MRKNKNIPLSTIFYCRVPKTALENKSEQKISISEQIWIISQLALDTWNLSTIMRPLFIGVFGVLGGAKK